MEDCRTRKVDGRLTEKHWAMSWAHGKQLVHLAGAAYRRWRQPPEHGSAGG